VAAAPPKPAPATFAEDGRPLPHYHSKRFALSLPLPEGATWRIDDHTHPELVATQAPTRSKVVVAVFHADELVGREQCEELARTHHLVRLRDPHTLEDQVAITQETFDTRIWVAIEPGTGPTSPVVGHVMAFGGFLRKCYFFDFSTEVDGAADASVLSQRLAFARARILGGLQLDPFDAVPRQAPAGANVAPAP
jgi:hypothetical protein